MKILKTNILPNLRGTIQRQIWSNYLLLFDNKYSDTFIFKLLFDIKFTAKLDMQF